MEKREDERPAPSTDLRVLFLKFNFFICICFFGGWGEKNENFTISLETGAKRELYHFPKFCLCPLPLRPPPPFLNAPPKVNLRRRIETEFAADCLPSCLRPVCVGGEGGRNRNLRNGKVRASPPFPGWFSVDFCFFPPTHQKSIYK